MRANIKNSLKKGDKKAENGRQTKRLTPKGLEIVTQYADSSGIFHGLPELGKKTKMCSKDIVMTELALLTLQRANPKNVTEFSSDPEYFKTVLGITSDFPNEADFINDLSVLAASLDVSHILKSNAQMLMRNGVKLSTEDTVRLDVFTIPLDVNSRSVAKPESRVLAVAVIGSERYLCNMVLYQNKDEWLNNSKSFLYDTLMITKDLTDRPLLHMKLQDWIPAYLNEIEQHTGLHVSAILDKGGDIPNPVSTGRVVCTYVRELVNLITGEPFTMYYWTNTNLSSEEITDSSTEFSMDDYMLLSSELRKDIGLAELSFKITDANCLTVRLALLAYNILKLMSRKGENRHVGGSETW